MQVSGCENRFIENIRKIAFILAVVAIIFSLCNCLYNCFQGIGLLYKEHELGSIYNETYANIFTYIGYLVDFFKVCCYAFILALITYMINPEKMGTIFKKKSEIGE